MVRLTILRAPEQLISRRARTQPAKGAISKWRLTLTGMGLVLAISSAALPSTGQAQEAWRIDSAKPCSGTEPGAFEVYIYSKTKFDGDCAALGPGLYPHSWNLGLEDNAASSYKAGSGVRARLYDDANFSSMVDTLLPRNELESVTPGFKISSMRVETADRREDCTDLRAGEIGFFASNGDCIVLPDVIWVNADQFFFPRLNVFPSPEYIGLKDNSINKIDATKTLCTISLFRNAFFKDDFFVTLNPGKIYDKTDPLFKFVVGSISSIWITPNVMVPGSCLPSFFVY